jgi:hypothetical protein
MRTESPEATRRVEAWWLLGAFVSRNMDNTSSAIGKVLRELMARWLAQPLPLMIRLQMVPLVQTLEHSDVSQPSSTQRQTKSVSVRNVELVEAHMIVKLAVVVIVGFALGALWKAGPKTPRI